MPFFLEFPAVFSHQGRGKDFLFSFSFSIVEFPFPFQERLNREFFNRLLQNKNSMHLLPAIADTLPW